MLSCENKTLPSDKCSSIYFFSTATEWALISTFQPQLASFWVTNLLSSTLQHWWCHSITIKINCYHMLLYFHIQYGTSHFFIIHVTVVSHTCVCEIKFFFSREQVWFAAKCPLITCIKWFKVSDTTSRSLTVHALIQSHPNFTYLPEREEHAACSLSWAGQTIK